MTTRRRTRAGREIVFEHDCRLCGSALLNGGHDQVDVKRHKVCIACAWLLLEEMEKVYNAPRLTELQKLKHLEKHGLEGPKKRVPADQPGWVYYIRMGDAIKIGYATDVAKRMRAYPPTAELLAAHPGTTQTERDMHKRFRADLSQGREWFNPSDNLMDHIAGVLEQFGDASGMAYEYTRPKTEEERVRAMFDRKWLLDPNSVIQIAT